MSIPINIKIAGHTYEIKFDDVSMADKSLLGEIDYDEKVITLRNQGKKSNIDNTLVHEIVHGILYESGYEDPNIEPFVRVFSNVLYQVLKENEWGFLR